METDIIRDFSQLSNVLSLWLPTVMTSGVLPDITVGSGPESNGVSSETIFVTASWTANGVPEQRKFVVRMVPSEDHVPMYPSYRLDHQFDTMRKVAELADVPVPAVHWLEDTSAVLGMPFLVMEHVDGVVPPDLMPDTFGNNWFADATLQSPNCKILRSRSWPNCMRSPMWRLSSDSSPTPTRPVTWLYVRA
jgi:aminoglycoside phosphotransferase (APT) family kinase protein